jgi:hypothetical protein
VNTAALLLTNLGKQMRVGARSYAYLWSNPFIMSQRTGESFVTNARKDYSYSIEGAANITLQRPDLNKLFVQVRRATAADQRELLWWLRTKFKE